MWAAAADPAVDPAADPIVSGDARTERAGRMSGDDAVFDVAVVIPAWNAVDTIGRAVRSALTQTAPCAVLVIDDASPDATADAAEAEADALDAGDRLTVVRAPSNRGPAAARNLGLAAAAERGARWIVLLDADDVMEPGRIEGLLDAAGSRDAPEWDFVADDLYRVIEGALDGPRRRLVATSDFEPHALTFEAFVLGNLHGARGDRGELGFLKPMMRVDFLRKHSLRYDETVRLGEDYDLYARALAAGARMMVTNPLGYYAVERDSSISASHGAAELGAVLNADRALLARDDLTEAERRAVRRHMAPLRRERAWMRLIDAVKARAPAQALACFIGPPDVAISLIARLWEQVVLRTGRLFGGARTK